MEIKLIDLWTFWPENATTVTTLVRFKKQKLG